jgi:uncharacterized membrane protein
MSEEEEKKVTGPIQVFVIGFDHFEATGKIMAALRKVRKRGVIRLVDLLFVEKDQQGNIKSTMHATDLNEDERERLGAVAGGLIGLGAGGSEGVAGGAELGALKVAERDYGMSTEQLQNLADDIPAGAAGAIMVIEHHWAKKLRKKIAKAGGTLLAQAMITPQAQEAAEENRQGGWNVAGAGYDHAPGFNDGWRRAGGHDRSRRGDRCGRGDQIRRGCGGRSSIG